MTNEKLALTCLTMIIILIAPSINAFSIKTGINKKSEVSQKTGSVYGSVGFAHKPGYTIVPFALVWIGSKRDIANSQGQFNISRLQVERYYTLYFTAIGFVIKSLDVYVGGLNPHELVYPTFDEDDFIIKEKTKQTERTVS